MGAAAFGGIVLSRRFQRRQAMVAESISPLTLAAAMIGSTMLVNLRIVCSWG